MAMFEPGTEGTIKEIDESGEGSFLLRTEDGDNAWMPMRAVVGFENWFKGCKGAGCLHGASGGGGGGGAAPAPAPFVNFGPAPAVFAGGPVPAVDTSSTDFLASGCQEIGAVKDEYTLQLGMNSIKCWLHCKKQVGVKYFGLTQGHKCFCSKLRPGASTSSERCNLKCSGSPKEHCGGKGNVASVYTMINCHERTAQEEGWLANAASLKLADQFGSFDGQSCAQERQGLCELNGSTKMVGTPYECKLACWEAKGSEKCDGFTYNSDTERCTFFQDVLDGKVKKKSSLTCHWKMAGYPMNM